MIEKVINRLNELKDETFKKFSSSLNPTALPMLGVRIPNLRIIAKDIIKEDPIYFLEHNPLNFFELSMLQALVIGLLKEDINIVLKYVNDFIPYISDWSVCDTFCQSLKITKKYQKEVWEFLSNYFNSNKEFELRVVVVILMCHYINDEYISLVINFIDQTKHHGYYYKMGCAWCLQVIMVKYPDLCYEYLNNNHLDDWTFNKAIRKMIESYCISDDIKIKIKKLIRK